MDPEEQKHVNERLQKFQEFLNTDKIDSQFEKIFNKQGWYSGRIFGSKSGYHSSNPTHVYIPNANICTQEHGKVWYGDIDITRDDKILKKLASEVGAPLYIFYELDARWKNPNFAEALFKITSKEIILVKAGYEEYFQQKRGRWQVSNATVKRNQKLEEERRVHYRELFKKKGC